MRRFIIIFIFLIICFLLAIWSPWLYWNFDLRGLFGVNAPVLNSSLQVFSLAGEIEVFIDNQIVGSAKFNEGALIVDKITPGERLIKLSRKSELQNAFWEYQKVVTFEEGTTVVLSYNLGPSKIFSEGHLIYAIKKIDSSTQTKLFTTINVSDAIMKINNFNPAEVKGNKTSDVISLENQLSIEINKIGFEPLTFTILPNQREEREKLAKFDIGMEVQLMVQPLKVE